ncbi:type I-E CRISPR-associated protein Cse1/CasA [Streptomyces monomycini]|uniref:type I-E CRISPR-associated protein Cse1/CasA n=1 Tax=Streptomyces monomycini TaxID=371720 RepID=UPI000995F263|nr:type I-E CRISPR-associated protein Cse1/CasA [Streptomyces monomycini]
MSYPFSVADNGWIPVRVRFDLDADETEELRSLVPEASPGECARVGLRCLFQGAHLFADLDFTVPPVEAVARRLLAAVTARVTGLDTGTSAQWPDARDDLLATGRFDADRVDEYLETHSHRLNLYDSTQPFLQDIRLAQECGKGQAPGRLVMDRPSGNNAVWTTHLAQDVPVPGPDAVQWLLAWYGYGPSGTATPRTHASRTSGSCKAGPYRSLVSYFPHAPERLFASLVASVPGPSAWPTGPGPDLAPWESDELPDPLAPAPACGPVSLLTGRTAHALLLTGDDAGQTTGCKITWNTAVDLPAAVDPYVIERTKGGPLRADRTRSAWRDLDALLLKTQPGSKSTLRRPTVFDAVAELAPAVQRQLGVRVLAWDQERQEKDNQWYAATTPPVLQHIEESDAQGAAAIATARRSAEAAAGDLARALSAAWLGVHVKRDPQQRHGFVEAARAQFWERAEEEFWQAVRAPDPDRRPAFRRLALERFDQATATLKSTVHGMSAVAKARARLARPRT